MACADPHETMVRQGSVLSPKPQRAIPGTRAFSHALAPTLVAKNLAVNGNSFSVLRLGAIVLVYAYYFLAEGPRVSRTH